MRIKRYCFRMFEKQETRGLSPGSPGITPPGSPGITPRDHPQRISFRTSSSGQLTSSILRQFKRRRRITKQTQPSRTTCPSRSIDMQRDEPTDRDPVDAAIAARAEDFALVKKRAKFYGWFYATGAAISGRTASSPALWRRVICGLRCVTSNGILCGRAWRRPPASGRGRVRRRAREACRGPIGLMWATGVPHSPRKIGGPT
jgi:hypothetical protein